MVRSNRDIFDKAVEVERLLPNDPALAKLWPLIANTVSIETEPAGAEVVWKDYDTPDAEWRPLGVTPFKDARVPRDFPGDDARAEADGKNAGGGPPRSEQERTRLSLSNARIQFLSSRVVCIQFYGGQCRTRTCDLLLVRQASQQSRKHHGPN